jgi:hypothetical protein
VWSTAQREKKSDKKAMITTIRTKIGKGKRLGSQKIAKK